MEEKFNVKNLKVRYDKKNGQLYITVQRKLDGKWDKDDYAEKFISDFRQIVYRFKEIDGKTVYEYKRRVDIYVPDEENKEYSVLDLAEVSGLFGGEVEENREFGMNELLALEKELRERKQEIVDFMEQKDKAQANQKQ